jgi:hypothetical protein
MLFKRPRKKYNWLWWSFIMLGPDDVIYVICLNHKVKAQSNINFTLLVKKNIS